MLCCVVLILLLVFSLLQSLLSAQATLNQEKSSLIHVKERLEERVTELEASVAHLEEECNALQQATQLAKGTYYCTFSSLHTLCGLHVWRIRFSCLTSFVCIPFRG